MRFGEQSEQMISLTTMQGRVGLGDRPMKVSIAYVKGKVEITSFNKIRTHFELASLAGWFYLLPHHTARRPA